MKALALAIALGLVATQAHAAVEVLQPWSRPAAAGTTGGGYMTLVNRGPKADALISVTSPAAREVQAHQSMVSGGMSMMHKVERLELAPGASVTFAPGGYHLMFVGLTKAL